MNANMVSRQFEETFGQSAQVVSRAPGRVNLIGEHTDYNDGFVFPTAINREMLVAASRSTDGKVSVWSNEYEQLACFDIDDRTNSNDAPWSNYVKAVIDTLQKAGYEISSFKAVVSGNVPQGAGLSSSAAFEVALFTALTELFSLGIDPKTVALLAQRAENEFIGVKCGIMDQFVSALGEADTALLIDCRSLEYCSVPLNLEELGASIVIINSGVRRGLVDSEYNARRAECEQGVAALRQLTGRSLKALRDVTLDELNKHGSSLPEVVYRRCRHIVSENERVLRAVEALEAGDLQRFGDLLVASHTSLRDDYQVSRPELDELVALTMSHPAAIGARMTGAGFGGCSVSLIRTNLIEDFLSVVLPEYERRTGKQSNSYVCVSADGAGLISAELLAG